MLNTQRNLQFNNLHTHSHIHIHTHAHTLRIYVLKLFLVLISNSTLLKSFKYQTINLTVKPCKSHPYLQTQFTTTVYYYSYYLRNLNQLYINIKYETGPKEEDHQNIVRGKITNKRRIKGISTPPSSRQRVED